MVELGPFSRGQTIASKYRIEGLLGRGAMGVVVSAWHLGLQQRVAIKLLSRELVHADDMARERFLREARLAARIHSEHVCRVLDTGALDDGTPFMVMEYLEGKDLAAELAQRGRLDVVEAAIYLRQACAGLSVAHAAGVVHRDLKPANLFLVARAEARPLLKVLDFGVSKAFVDPQDGSPGLTRTAAMVGSPLYMSPEQFDSSRDVDVRTDIWALGTILYELVTGRTPFRGDSVPQLVHAVLNQEPPGFEALGVHVPAGFEAVVRRALSKSVTERYASANELSLALGVFTPDASAADSGSVWVATRVGSQSAAREGSHEGQQRRRIVGRVALGLVVLGALAALWQWHALRAPLADRASEMSHDAAKTLPAPEVPGSPEPTTRSAGTSPPPAPTPAADELAPKVTTVPAGATSPDTSAEPPRQQPKSGGPKTRSQGASSTVDALPDFGDRH